jgi:hypothetical protein
MTGLLLVFSLSAVSGIGFVSHIGVFLEFFFFFFFFNVVLLFERT